nr:iron-containing alcohol dehydrogenase [uncultured Acidaminococcus sp.]
MANRISLNGTSYHGSGAIKDIITEFQNRGFTKAFVASDPDLVKFKVTAKVTDLLDAANIPYTVYSDIKPNPTIANVQHGVEALQSLGR